MKIDIWSDIGCPFCYLGTTQLNEALAGFEHRDRVEVRHHSFQLDPGAPRQTDMRVVEMLANKRGIPVEQAEAMNQQVAKAFEASGLSMNYKEAQPVNTFDAHRLVHFAASQGQQEAVLPRLFKAYFTDGQNTADVETLVRLAGEAGLDTEQTRAMLASDQYAAEVQADISRAAQLGIHGVPFFIFEGKYAISGAQGAEAFSQALQQVWAEVSAA
ncbi:MAG: DsbA family oxidoreductase [Enhydrobacter sp.]|nr:DsbA family oxidoreductase [Enhydrobacter sp.]